MFWALDLLLWFIPRFPSVLCITFVFNFFFNLLLFVQQGFILFLCIRYYISSLYFIVHYFCSSLVICYLCTIFLTKRAALKTLCSMACADFPHWGQFGASAEKNWYNRKLKLKTTLLGLSQEEFPPKLHYLIPSSSRYVSLLKPFML